MAGCVSCLAIPRGPGYSCLAKRSLHVGNDPCAYRWRRSISNPLSVWGLGNLRENRGARKWKGEEPRFRAGVEDLPPASACPVKGSIPAGAGRRGGLSALAGGRSCCRAVPAALRPWNAAPAVCEQPPGATEACQMQTPRLPQAETWAPTKLTISSECPDPSAWPDCVAFEDNPESDRGADDGD